MLRIPATIAFLGIAAASKGGSGTQDSSLFASKGEYWLRRQKSYSDSTCSSEGVTKTDYFKLSGECIQDGGSYHQLSCLTDPLVNGVIVIDTNYGTSNKCQGDREYATSQTATLYGQFHTSCYNENLAIKNGSPKYTSYPHSGSEVFSCLHVQDDQLPFTVDAGNTFVQSVGYDDALCSMDQENVLTATVWNINRCEKIGDFSNAWAGGWNTIKSMRISDCGFEVEYFTDDNCQDRDSSKSEQWSADLDFDQCNTVFPDAATYARRGLLGEHDRNDLDDAVFKSDKVDMEKPSSWRAFCAGSDYGLTAKKSHKVLSAGSLGIKLGGEDVSFTSQVESILFASQFATAAGEVAAADEVVVTSFLDETTPMNYAYLGSVAFFGIVVGAAFTAKFYKSKGQFEGVEMQSAHSNL